MFQDAPGGWPVALFVAVVWLGGTALGCYMLLQGLRVIP